MYVLEPGETRQVEASADPIGLRMGIIYEADTEEMKVMFQKYTTKRDSVLTITYINGQDISTFGGDNILF